ncbi:MAG: nuclear transport factor 2 family protein [Gammaproteobacteria bacterium]|nr:nuclear transport factor 2 family protein [Gammaproteobacteria bacterium]
MNIKRIVGILCLLLSASSFADDSVDEAIIAQLRIQQDAWNNGDLNVFLSIYARDEGLMVVGSDVILTGITEVRERYETAYDTSESMGQLEFELNNLYLIDDNHAWVLGSWKLTDGDAESTGFFTTLWQKNDGVWLIIRDHTPS